MVGYSYWHYKNSWRKMYGAFVENCTIEAVLGGKAGVFLLPFITENNGK